MTKVKDGTPLKVETASHTDARGRLITVRKLNALNFYNLTKALGHFSSNAATMDMAMIVATVSAINTTKFPVPATEQDIKLLIQELDFDGIAAAGEALKKLAPDPEAEKEVAKN